MVLELRGESAMSASLGGRSVTFSDGDAAHPRVDLVAWQAPGWLVVVLGPPGPAPVAPCVDASYLPLFHVRVNAGVSAGNGGIAADPGWGAAVSAAH